MKETNAASAVSTDSNTERKFGSPRLKGETAGQYLKNTIVIPLSVCFCRLKAMLCAEKAFFIILFLSFLAVIGINFIAALERGGMQYLNVDDFAIGKVAERDVSAGRDISYTDQDATDIRKAARLQTLLPIFRQDSEIVSETLKKYDEFVSFILSLSGVQDEAAFAAQVNEKYPAFFELRFLQSLPKFSNIDLVLAHAQSIVKQTMAVGIAEFPESGLEQFNQTEITLLTWHGHNKEYTNVQKSALIDIKDLTAYIKDAVSPLDTGIDDEGMFSLIYPFLQVTVFYDEKETNARAQEMLKQVPPVIITIPKNQKIIKRGFIITAENYRQLQAYADAGNYLDVSKLLALILFILCLYAAGLFTFSKQAVNGTLKESQKIFLLLISFTVYTGILFAGRIAFFVMPLDIVPFIPAALTAMLALALISVKTAVMTVFFTMLLVLTATGFKLEPALFALFSGMAAVSLMKLTGRRIDLIKTSYQLAAIHPVITGVLMGVFPNSYSSAAFVIAGSVINGFISGIFMLGFLPILEDRMNTPTCFRLMELSDLNSPTMKNMLLSASGTYNHTMMVAMLSEAACREIGANALLARVGAYYHDIGKMANNEYFVENQTSYNKHFDLNPRLSATIIRSHVKIGVEKAESMRLPPEVIDIIREHHGNSLVQYFYAKAKELDPNVDPKDFSYPGQPPRSKESAVVMLADITEAACRTLDHPSVPRLEKFIGKLIKAKIDAEQLDNSELTLRELKIIQESFVMTLAGYYHSRIKYPNQKDPDEQPQQEPERESEKEIPSDVKKYLKVDLGLDGAEQQPAPKEDAHNE